MRAQSSRGHPPVKPLKQAQWIWRAGQCVHSYNLAAQFRRVFEAEADSSGLLRITGKHGQIIHETHANQINK